MENENLNAYSRLLLLSFYNLLFIFVVAGQHQEDKVCESPGWNYQQTACPNDTVELFRDVDIDNSKLEKRVCCRPEHEDYEEIKEAAYICRITSCVNSTYNPCTSLDPRYVNNFTMKLEYEEILREPCSNDEGRSAVCCVKNSTEGLLATTLGAELGEFPHQAKLRLPSHCGATIYNSKFLITASHCVIDRSTGQIKPLKEMEVILGSNNGRQQDTQYVYSVKTVIPHPGYSKLPTNSVDYRTFNDIALMELNREIQFGSRVKALQIAPKNFVPSKYAQNVCVVGWGTSDNLDLSVHLQKANFRIRRDQSCFLNGEDSRYSHYKGFEDQLLCIGGIFEGSWSPTAGGGDSGGPAVCRDSKGRAVLCGVTSFGGDDDDCRGLQNEENCPPSVYADVGFFHDWIKENAGEQDPSTLYQPFLYGESIPLDKQENTHQVFISVPKAGKFCGGTLVAPDVVVTSAQCIVDGNNNSAAFKDVVITAGVSDLYNRGEVFHEIKNFSVLSGFKLDTETFLQGDRIIMADSYFKNDLAVVKLKTPTNVTKFPDLPMMKGDVMKNDGIIATEVAFPRDTRHSGEMLQRKFRILDKKDCQNRMNRMSRAGMNIKVDENILCGSEIYSCGSLCDREIGGGLICSGNKGQDVLCGVSVFRLCEFSIPNGFIDVSVYSSWIRETMRTFA